MVSQHSKNIYETASLNKSIRGASNLSLQQKKQVTKVLKKVSFFSLKAESQVADNKSSMCDSEEDGEKEDLYHIDEMNKSIRKNSKNKLKRNIKSFNFTPE